MADYAGFIKNNPPDMRCNIRGCKQRNPDRIRCCAENCNKICHYFCYHDIILKSKDGEKLTSLPDDRVACTKACHLNIMKALSGPTDSGRGAWTSGLMQKMQ